MIFLLLVINHFGFRIEGSEAISKGEMALSSAEW